MPFIDTSRNQLNIEPMGHFIKLSRIYLYILISGLLPASFWLWHFAKDQWIESRDTMHLFYVLKRWSWMQLQNGELPLWNPHLFTGYYQAASPALGIFSPITAIFYNLFDSYLAEQMQFPFFAALAGVGAFLLAKEFSVNSINSVLFAIAFSLSGFLLSLPDRSPYYFAYALYPLTLFLIVKANSSNIKSQWAGLGLSLALSLIFCNGDWVGAIVFCAIHVILALRALRWTSLWPIALGLCLSSIFILPTLENLEESTRAHGIALAEASAFSLHPFRLISFFVPEYWGYPNDRSFWGHGVSSGPFSPRFWYHSVYLGSVISALGFFGWRYSSKKIRLLITFSFSFFIILSFGTYAFLHDFLFDNIPLYKNLRYPEKFLIFSGFIWFVAAIIGLNKVSALKKWHSLLFVIGMIHVGAFFVGKMAPTAAQLQSDYSISAMSAELATDHISKASTLHLLILGIIFLLHVPLLQKFTSWGLIAITCIELLWFAPPMHWVNSTEFTDEGLFTSQIQKSTGRYLLDIQILPYTNRKKVMLSNWPILDGLNDVSGYETIMPLRLMSIRQDQLYAHLDVWARVLNWTDVITFASPRNEQLLVHANNGSLEPLAINKELNLALLHWNKIISPVEFFTSVVESASAEETLRKVIERGTQKGSAIIEGKASTTLSTSEELKTEWTKTYTSLNKVEYQVSTSEKSLFVERSAYNKGWHVEIDGQPAELLRVDGFSKGVWVPTGNHKIRFEFRPRLFFIASIISAIAAAIFILIALKNAKTLAQNIRNSQ